LIFLPRAPAYLHQYRQLKRASNHSIYGVIIKYSKNSITHKSQIKRWKGHEVANQVEEVLNVELDSKRIYVKLWQIPEQIDIKGYRNLSALL
jgi:hypothetical protein